MNEDCKHCKDGLPNITQSLRSNFRFSKSVMIMNMLRCNEDKDFEDLQNKKYCCNAAWMAAEDAYNEYFPYKGMWHIQQLIQELYEVTLEVNSLLDPTKLTAEDCLKLDTCDGKIARCMQSINFAYCRLIKLSENVEKALEREKDPEKRKLLDGRK